MLISTQRFGLVGLKIWAQVCVSPGADAIITTAPEKGCFVSHSPLFTAQ